MFLHIEGIEVPKKLMYHVCFDDGRKFFYFKPEYVIPLGETQWPDPVKDEVVNIFRVIGIEQPLRQKLVEPFAAAFGGKKEVSGVYNLEKVNWEQLVDYFRWESQAISSQADNDEFEVRAEALQARAVKKYGSRFLRYLVYANPDCINQGASIP
jgi:hypothetical protein